MKQFVCLRSNDGKWLVTSTIFDRQPGDNMKIDGINYLVITTGSRDCCIDVMNFNIKQNRKHLANGKRPVYPAGNHIERNLLK